MKRIGITKKLSKTLPWHGLITIHKSFVRPHLDYGDFMTSQIMKVSIKKLKELNTMLLLQLQVLSKEHLRVNHMMNQVLNHLNLIVGFGNYVLFIKSKQLEYQNICLISFLKPIVYTILVHPMLQHFTAELMYISFLE